LTRFYAGSVLGIDAFSAASRFPPRRKTLWGHRRVFCGEPVPAAPENDAMEEREERTVAAAGAIGSGATAQRRKPPKRRDGAAASRNEPVFERLRRRAPDAPRATARL